MKLRGRDRPKLTCTSAIRKDMKDCCLYGDFVVVVVVVVCETKEK